MDKVKNVADKGVDAKAAGRAVGDVGTVSKKN